jgi:ParB family chromosome partitioning protein
LSAKQKLFAWCIASCLKPQLAVEDRSDPVLEAASSRLAIPFADCWRPTAANYWGRVKKAHGLAVPGEILGERWARDHAGDKKPVLAAALETAFDPAKSEACIGLGQTARDAAAAWLPPGMPYDGALADARPDHVDHAAPDRAAADDIDPAAAELPAFLTADEPGALGDATAA